MASSSDATTAYAEQVVAGKIVAGKPVRQACERHLRDLKEGESRGLTWRPEKAEVRFRFFENVLVLPDGKPFKLEPFQKFIVGSVFGWYRATGTRRFRMAYVETAKGSGKTPLAAGIGLSGLVVDDEPAPEIYSAAVTRDQAKICFRDAEMMTQASPLLSDRLDTRVASILAQSTNGVMRPVSSEHRGLDGLRPYIALIDEIHEHPDAMVVDKIRAGTKRRLDALIFEITNSGYNRNSVCWQHHEYSLKLLDQAMEDDSWFAYVAAVDEGDDPMTDPSCWVKANPGLGTILPVQYVEEQVREAKGMPSKENIVRRLNFCQWTEQATRWLPMEMWRNCDSTRKIEDYRGQTCYAGLDLATVRDIAAFELAFPADDTGTIATFGYYFVPEEKILERAKKDRVPYDQWAREGWLISTPGNVIDYGFIRSKIQEIADRVIVKEIGYDRWNASQIVTDLQGDGFTMVPIGQGFASMSSPAKELEKLVVSSTFAFDGNPVTTWMASNVTVKQDPAGNIKPDKERSGDRIDGIVAICMALSRLMVNTHEDLSSHFAEEGVMFL